jgi:hypothetical protein
VFLEDDLTIKIIGHGRVQWLLKDGRVKTLHDILHILSLAKNLISMSKMSDSCLHTIIENHTCKMVKGAMVLLRGSHIGSLYKLLERDNTNDCNNVVFHENETDKTPTLLVEKTMLYYQSMGHVERKAFMLCIVKAWLKVSLTVL